MEQTADQTSPVKNPTVETPPVEAPVNKASLLAAGYKALNSSEKQLTVSKDAPTWVIAFSVGLETKATVDVTH